MGAAALVNGRLDAEGRRRKRIARVGYGAVAVDAKRQGQPLSPPRRACAPMLEPVGATMGGRRAVSEAGARERGYDR